MNELFLPGLDSPGSKCEYCGADYTRKRNDQRFCSIPCSDRQQSREIKARADLIRSGLPVAPKPLNERQQNMLADYKRGIGLCSLARIYGVTKNAIKKNLIKTGEYAPDPRRNGTAKKGGGRKAEIEKQKSERKAQRDKELRHIAAVCLAGLRRGIGIIPTCRDNKWSEGNAFKFISERTSYKRWKDSHPAHQDQMAGRRLVGSRTNKYKDEREFSDSVELVLKEAGIEYTREFYSSAYGGSVDFLVGGYAIECKVSTDLGSTHSTLGQLACYRNVLKLNPILLIPSDVKIPIQILPVIRASCECILNENNLLEFLSGKSITQLPDTLIAGKVGRGPARSVVGKCKCCGVDAIRARSNSGRGRPLSYCVECQKIIHLKAWDSRTAGWVDKTHAYQETLIACGTR